MKMVVNAERRVIRHLTAAEGYLELGMPQTALRELEEVKEPGQFAVPHWWLKGEALKADGRFEEAIEPLNQAIGKLPTPLNDLAKSSLMECLKQTGRIVETSTAEGEAPSVENLEDSEKMPSSRIATGAKPQVSVTQTTTGQAEHLEVPTLRLEVPSIGTVSLKIEPGKALVIRIERTA